MRLPTASQPHSCVRLVPKRFGILGTISQTFQVQPLRVPLIDLLFLMSILMKTVPGEVKNLTPGQLHDHRTIFPKLFIPITSHCDQTHAQSVAFIVAVPIDVARRQIDLLLRKAADRGENAVHILAILKRPWSIQSAGLIGLDFSDNDVDQFRRKSECVNVILHRLIVIKQEFRAVREADGKQVSIGPLPAPAAWVDDEVLDLKEAVQPEIPVGDFLWEETRPIPFTSFRQRGHAAALR